MSRALSLARARRIALAAQGLDRPRPVGRLDRRHLRRVARQLRVIQLDTVNVMARAHYMPFYSRLGGHPRARIDDWLWHSGELFEYWGHAISLMPVEDYPLLRHRMRTAGRWPRIRRLMAERPGYVEQVRDEVLQRGPLTMAELRDGGRRLEGWYRSEARLALEHLFARGELAAVRTPSFTRVYGAPEALLPAAALAAPPLPRDEAWRRLLLAAAHALGLGSARDLADYYRLPPAPCRALLADLVAEGRLEGVEVEGWSEPAYLHPRARSPRRADARGLVSPFDSLLWHRERVERLWGFRYRIEIYVPKAQRRHGYYVLPFLMGEALVARLDLKADRQAGRLLVRAAWLEEGQDARRVAGALSEELRELAEWLALDRVTVEPRGDLAATLRRALAPRAGRLGGPRP